jgi:putative methionine-R-sulfoxide reductase with GAF domain
LTHCHINPIIDVDRHVLAFFAASDGIVLENLAAQFSTEVAAVKMASVL